MILRYFSTGAKLSHSCHPTLPANQTASYQDVLFNLLNQARSSVLLQVCTQPNVDTNFLCEEIHKFCSRKGPVVFLGELQHPHGSANEVLQLRLVMFKIRSCTLKKLFIKKWIG